MFEASWTLGTAQTLLRTGDGGHSWDLLTPLVDAPLPGRNRAFLPYTGDYDPATVAEQIKGVAVGADAPHGLPGALGYLDQVVFPSPDIGYALVQRDSGWPPEDFALLRSGDGGHTWQALSIGERLGTKSPPYPMRFPRADAGFVMAREALLCTEDGGGTWEERPYPPGGRPLSVIFSMATVGYALTASRLPRRTGTREEMDAKNAEGRALFRTEDAGRSWQQVGTVVAARLLGCPGPEIVLAIGGGGQVRRSADSGCTWRDVDTMAPHWPQAVACPDERTCYAVASDATILKSDDGGQRWHVLTTGLAALYDLLDGSHLLHCDKDMRGHSRIADSG